MSTPPPLALDLRYTDDPATVAREVADDYSAHVVPTGARVPKWQLAMSAWSTVSAMVWLFYGALVASLYGTHQALIGIGVSVVLYTLGTQFFVRWAAKTGLSSALLSRRMFGVVGSALIALLLAATTTYYTVFESSTLAAGFKIWTGHLDIKWWYLIVVIAILPLTLGTVQTWFGRLNAYLLPLFLVGLVAVLVSVVVDKGMGTRPAVGPTGKPTGGTVDWFSFPGVVPDFARPLPGWLLVVVLYLGLSLTLPVAADFARFAKPRDTRFHQSLTFGFLYYLFTYGVNGVVGIYITQAMLGVSTEEAGVVVASIGTLGFIGLLFIVVTQARINSLNYYLSVLNWDRLLRITTGKRLPRLVWVTLLSTVVFLLMLTDVFSYLQTAMNWQGVCMIGWVSIVLTHMLLVPADRKNGPEFRATRLPALTPALAVWAVTTGIGIWLIQDKPAPTDVSSFYARIQAMPAVVVLVLSAVLYAGVVLATGTSRFTKAVDIRGEIAEPFTAQLVCAHCERQYAVQEMDLADGQVVCDECATSSRFGGHPLKADSTALPVVPAQPASAETAGV